MSRETRPELIVLKLGGTTLAEQQPLLAEIAEVARERPIVVVHGGGKRLTEWLERLGVPTRFEDGLRVTDEAGVEVAVAVLGGLVNGELVGALRRLGVDAVGLTGLDGGLLVAERVPALGLVAHVTGVRRYILERLLAAGSVPLVAPLALDESGQVCNVNADDAAAGIAAGTAADLVLLTDVDGVQDADGARLAGLSPEEAEALIARGVIERGMVPKVRACLEAVRHGARSALIADGGAKGALRRAIDDPAFGTRLAAPSLLAAGVC